MSDPSEIGDDRRSTGLAALHHDRIAAAEADAMHSPEELQSGMFHPSATVRLNVLDRLIARAPTDPNTVPVLIKVLDEDLDSEVRSLVAGRLYSFPDDPNVVSALTHARDSDPDEQVRAEAVYSLEQLGIDV